MTDKFDPSKTNIHQVGGYTVLYEPKLDVVPHDWSGPVPKATITGAEVSVSWPPRPRDAIDANRWIIVHDGSTISGSREKFAYYCHWANAMASTTDRLVWVRHPEKLSDLLLYDKAHPLHPALAVLNLNSEPPLRRWSGFHYAWKEIPAVTTLEEAKAVLVAEYLMEGGHG